jgi:hypothetical protein
VHSGGREPESHGAQPPAHLPRQEDSQAAVGRADSDEGRHNDHGMLVFYGESTRQPMDSDIVHRHDAATQQQRRCRHARISRLADA